MAACAGASTPVHMNRMATLAAIKMGATMLYCESSSMDTIDALRNWDHTRSYHNHTFEGALLESGDVL